MMEMRFPWVLSGLISLAGIHACGGGSAASRPVAQTQTEPFTMKVLSFQNGGAIPPEYAFCEGTEDGKATFGQNKSPHVSWSGVPAGTKVLALMVVDPDVPREPDAVNKEGELIAEAAPRTNFYHWLVANIPPSKGGLEAGLDSRAVVPGGKTPGTKAYGVTGVNTYSKWFASDAKMSGNYGGYDGPCPPWNDERVHRYVFHLYALDQPLTLPENFTAEDLQNAMRGHVLGEARWEGIYSLNPRVFGPVVQP